jgi:hypothetical protein
VRAGVAAVDRDRAYAGDHGWHATALVAVSDLQR